MQPRKVKLYMSKAWLMMELASKTPEEIASEQKVTAQTIYNAITMHRIIRR